MKILMVLDHEFPSDIRVEKEIKTLVSEGYNVDIACFTQKGRIHKEMVANCTIYRKPISKLRIKTSAGALKLPFYFNFWRKFLSEIIKKTKYDAIHIHDLPLARVGFEMAKKFNFKFVLDLHENWPVLMMLSPHTKTFIGKILHNNRQWLNYEQKYSSLADGLVVVADEMKNRLLINGVKNKYIFTVPNTSELDIYNGMDSVQPDSSCITLFYSGGISKHRGLDLVIRGLSKMKLPNNFRFWIVGKGREESHLKKMTVDLKVEEYVTFFGWKKQSEVFELILKSDITLIPHLKTEHSDNTSPNKIFHYMLAKKPILATNCNYISNIVNETNSGLIFENNNEKDLIEKLSYLLQNRVMWDELGENGYNIVRTKYNWNNTSKTLIELYQKINTNDN